MTVWVDSVRMDELKQNVAKSIDKGSDIRPTIAEKWTLGGKKSSLLLNPILLTATECTFLLQ
jgi:hypothetical protein